MLSYKDHTNGTNIIQINNDYIINGHYYDRNFRYKNQKSNYTTSKLCVPYSTLTNNGTVEGIEKMQSQIQYNDIIYFIDENNIKSYDTETGTFEIFYTGTTTYKPCKLLYINSLYMFLLIKNSRNLYCLARIENSSKTIKTIGYNSTATGRTSEAYSVDIIKIEDNIIYFINFRGRSVYTDSRFSLYREAYLCKYYIINDTLENNVKQIQYQSREHIWSEAGDPMYGTNFNNIFHVFNILSLQRFNNFILFAELPDMGSGQNVPSPDRLRIYNSILDESKVIIFPSQMTNEAPIRYWSINNNIFIIFYNQYVNSVISKFYKYNYDTEELEIIYDDSQKTIKTVILSQDKHLLLINQNNYSDIYFYDENLETYYKTSNISNISQVGIDSFNRIWYINSSNEIFYEDIEDPFETDLQFEKPMYTFINDNINTYFTFNAKTSIGLYAFGRYTFELSKNAYFTQNNSRYLSSDYDMVDKKYNIVIHDSGRVICKVKYNKIWGV